MLQAKYHLLMVHKSSSSECGTEEMEELAE